MKLLSQPQIKTHKQDVLEQARVVDKYFSAKVKELNDFKRGIESQKSKILNDFIAFAESIGREKTKLEDGILTTEERKSQSFKSLAKISMDSEQRYKLAQETENKTRLKERKIQEREDNLEKKTKIITSRELMLNEKASDISKRSELIGMQEDELETLKLKTNADIERRERKMKKQEDLIIEQLGELNLSAQANKKTAELLTTREKQFEETMKEERTKLEDGRATLARGFEELRKKQQ